MDIALKVIVNVKCFTITIICSHELCNGQSHTHAWVILTVNACKTSKNNQNSPIRPYIHMVNVGLTVWTVRIHALTIGIGYMRMCGAVYHLQVSVIAEIAGHWVASSVVKLASYSIAWGVYNCAVGKFINKEKREIEEGHAPNPKTYGSDHMLYKPRLAFITNANLTPATTTSRPWDCRTPLLG